MTKQDQAYIEDNRLKMSMVDMATHLRTSYNRVRDYMIANQLMLSKEQVNEIRRIKREAPKSWNWNALR